MLRLDVLPSTDAVCGGRYTYHAHVYVERWAASQADSLSDGELAAPLKFEVDRSSTPGTRSFVDDAVEPGVPYVYQVRAVNSIGVGEPSLASEVLQAARHRSSA